MDYVKKMAAELSQRMEIPTHTKKESGVSFVGQKPMEKIKTTATIASKNATDKKKDIRPTYAQIIQKPADVSSMRECKGQTFKGTIVSNPINNAHPSAPNVLNLDMSVSKISNLMGDYLEIIAIFHSIKNEFQDKRLEERDFYRRIQNCIYHSLFDFCGLIWDDNDNIIIPSITNDMKCIPTLTFLDRVFNYKSLSFERPNNLMDKYRRIFTDSDGVQSEWIEMFKAQMREQRENLPLGDKTIDKIANAISSTWCSTIEKEYNEEIPIETPGDFVVSVPMQKAKIETQATIIQKPFQEPEEEDSDEDEDEEDEDIMCVDIECIDGFDIVRIKCSDYSDYVYIPFYTNLENIPTDKIIPSIVDNRNGIWDWLIHFVPEILFKTKDPMKYIKGNEFITDSEVKIVIMDESDEVYTLGVHYIKGVFLVDENGNKVEDSGEDIIRQINYLVNDEIGGGTMSHLPRSLTMKHLFREEEFILSHVMNFDSSQDEEEDENQYSEESNGDIPNEATRAAIDAMTETSATVCFDTPLPIYENVYYEERQEEEETLDNHPPINIGGKQYNEDKVFTFTPMRRKQSLDD